MKHEARFGFIISKLSRDMIKNLENRLKVYEITLSQWALLKTLQEHDGIAQVELQERLELEAATITGLIQRMLRHGSIKRVPDLIDKRVQRVFLTEKGHERLRACEAIVQDHEQVILRGFSEDEAYLFRRLLQRARQNIQQEF